MSTVLDQNAAGRARELYTREGLPFPPVPDHLAARLEADGEAVFTTRDLEWGPYNIEIFVQEMVEGNHPDEYAVLGFDGHGTNSWATHYFLVQPGLALFLQLPWGGAYDDPDEARRLISQAFEWAAAIQAAVQRNLPDGAIPAGWRLLVVRSDFTQSGWAWLPHPAPGSDRITWHEADDILNEATSALLDVLDGKQRLP